jgi:predicted Zn-dependent protease with MMP-like domain
MFSDISDDHKLFVALLAIALVFGLAWWWNGRAKKWLEEHDLLEWVPSRLDELAIGPKTEQPRIELKYSPQEFEEMVSKAIDEVPQEFDKEWKNLAVVVSTDWASAIDKKRMGVPENHLILGTYSGQARTKGFRAENSSAHTIIVYQPVLELLYGQDKEKLQQEIRKVVLHELAHHLGISHRKMSEIGLA